MQVLDSEKKKPISSCANIYTIHDQSIAS